MNSVLELLPSLSGLAIVLWTVFLLVRRPFLDAMIRSGATTCLLLAYDLERRAAVGAIDPQSAFYRYHHGLALSFASQGPERFPGLIALLLSVTVSAIADSPESTAFREMRRDALTDDFNDEKHGDVARALYVTILEMLRYDSLLVWSFVKAVELGIAGGGISLVAWVVRARDPDPTFVVGPWPTAEFATSWRRSPRP